MQSEKWGKSRCCGISEEGVQDRYEEVREGFLDVMAELKLEGWMGVIQVFQLSLLCNKLPPNLKS